MPFAEPGCLENHVEPFHRTHDLVEPVTVRDVHDIRDCARALCNFAAEFDFRAALCGDIATSEPMVDAQGNVLAADAFGWLGDGERWWEDHRLALRSPLPRACRYEAEPFWCNAQGFHTLTPNPYLDEIGLTDFFESRFRARATIVVPVHLPFAQVSANCFIHRDLAKTDLTEEFAELGAILGLLTRRFISTYVSTMRSQKRRIPGNCDLTKREVECLRWAALGKTDREVSEIIGISHATVRYHLQRAAEKLESVNRTQTIFKAGQLGFLGASN
ncbi:helix-turn-helix transcriptional regulator [Novosphingobium olei]|uniref:Helix-turn-helix transcriptional regulator n=1 Tax=Novosphingobium olei TaxID=2728851 RepID=A0A7Y0G8K4_9SPHN|nr:helix-turn-helix transcriptional regulator [Novosphingobium olei]NML92153.1 helix-turn-helix transcriptional regulator [Novosphingobium olei]